MVLILLGYEKQSIGLQMLNAKNILITGRTGSFEKQFEMAKKFNDTSMRYFLLFHEELLQKLESTKKEES